MNEEQFQEFLEDVRYNRDRLTVMLEQDDIEGVMNHAEDMGLEFDDPSDYTDLLAKALLVVILK